MSTTRAGVHILVYPFPTSGHIIPLLDLAHRLLTHGLRVTVLVTPNNVPLLESLISNHPSTSLQYLVLPQPRWSANSSNRLISFMRGLRELHYPALVNWFKSHPSPPVAILSDFFLGWTKQLADELGVPRVVFSPSGAFALSISFALWTDFPKNNEPDNEYFQVSFPRVPNCPVYPWYQISHNYRTSNEGNPDWEMYRSCMLANMASWGAVFNTFAELERVYIDHIEKEMGRHNRVWAVGPVLPPVDDLAESMSRGGSSSVQGLDVLTWLDSRKDHSVVYVCFGSRQVLTLKQMDELAAALEKTEVDFVWCVREPDERNVSEDCGLLPDGFVDRVVGRGYIIKGWAPQVAILRHRAVGAFLTHCGWNSVLEGISAGVVMLTWPMSADQFTNAQLLVDQLGVGIRVGEGTQNIPESSELARLLAQSVDGTGTERLKAKELSGAALSAVAKGGISDIDLDDFIKSINELKSGKDSQ